MNKLRMRSLLMLLALSAGCGRDAYPETGLYEQHVIEEIGDCAYPLYPVDGDIDLVVEDEGTYTVPIIRNHGIASVSRTSLSPETGWFASSPNVQISTDDMPRCRHAGRTMTWQILDFTESTLVLRYREEWRVEGDCERSESSFLFFPPKSCTREQTIRFSLWHRCQGPYMNDPLCSQPPPFVAPDYSQCDSGEADCVPLD